MDYRNQKMDYDKTFKTFEKLEALNPSTNGEVNDAYIKALSVCKEIIKWEGNPKPIFGHGYTYEKITKLNKIITAQRK